MEKKQETKRPRQNEVLKARNWEEGQNELQKPQGAELPFWLSSRRLDKGANIQKELGAG